MEFDQSYKSLCKATDFVVLVLGRTVNIINDKLLQFAANIDQDVGRRNWNETIKNYTTFMTSFNNLVGFSHTMNYSRKWIIRTLIGSKDPDYVRLKIESYSQASEGFLLHFATILTTLQYFVPIDDRGSQEIKSLADVHRVLSDARTSMQKKVQLAKQTSSDIKAKYKATGSGEIILENIQDVTKPVFKYIKPNVLRHIIKRVHEVKVQGGFDESKLYKVTLGSINEPPEIIVSGWHIDKLIEDHTAKKELISSYSGDTDNLAEDIKTLIIPATMNPESLLRYIINTSGSLNNLTKQSEKIILTGIDHIISYHIKRSIKLDSGVNSRIDSGVRSGINTQASAQINAGVINVKFTYSDNYGKIDDVVFWDPDKIPESIESMLRTIESIFSLIDKADIERIVSAAKTAFKSISDSGADSGISSGIRDLSSIIIEPDARKQCKDRIRADIQKIRSSIPDISFETDKKTLTKIANIQKTVSSDPIETLGKVIAIESELAESAKLLEENLDIVAQQLYTLMNRIDTMFDPNNTSTCIKKPALLVEAGIIALLKKTSDLDKIRKWFNIDKAYSSKTGLDFDFIRSECAAKLTGRIK